MYFEDKLAFISLVDNGFSRLYNINGPGKTGINL